MLVINVPTLNQKVNVQIIAAGSLAAGGIAGYLASGSVAFGVISGSCSLLYYARVYIQGYYFVTCYKGDGTDLAGVDDGFWSPRS